MPDLESSAEEQSRLLDWLPGGCVQDLPFNGASGAAAGALSPFCRVVLSWADTLDFRFRGSFPLKAGFIASFIYRNTPGAEESALLAVTSSSVTFLNPSRTTLNSPVTVNLTAPNSVFGKRFSQLDVGLNKTFNLGWARLRTAFDVFNALNSNSIETVNNTYNPTTWLKPTVFLDPRLARVTASIEF